jgi:hypothetical protein
MRLLSSATRSVLALASLLLACAPARAQPARPAQPPAELSRFDIGAYVSFKQMGEPAGGDGTWTGPGLSLDVNANLSKRLALATRVETYFDGTLSALAGAQVSGDFLYANSRDPGPGRFFAKALAGVVRERSGVTRPAFHVGAGADGILSGRRGIGFHWDAGWEIVPGSPYRRFRGRVAMGVIIGPHVRRVK